MNPKSIVETDPQHIVPPAPMAVSIPVSTKGVPTDAEARKNLEEIGLTFIRPSMLSSLASLGAYVEGLGVMKAQNGIAITNQQILLNAQIILSRKMNSAKISNKNAMALARAIGYIGSKVTEAQKFLAAHHRQLNGGIPEDSNKKRTPSFAPGAPVQINIHNGGDKKVEVVTPVEQIPLASQ